MFHSLYSITLSMVITALLIIWYALGVNPFLPVRQFFRDLITKRSLFLHFIGLVAILMVNKLELQIENEIPFVPDFTSFLFSLEGNFIPLIQQWFENDLLTFVLTYFYIVVFTALMMALLVIFHYHKDDTSFRALIYGVMLNYMIAIPFYLFFPVNEVWYHHPGVNFLIPQVYPAFEAEYRALSGLNNCFPSLHTSLSLTMAIISIKSKAARLGKLIIGCAGIIIFSIFYLGIHWFSDMLAGALLAVFAAHFAWKWSENRRLDTALGVNRSQLRT